ncbi:MAG TPA: class A beta-lactamase [Gemmatimonadales bacterium]
MTSSRLLLALIVVAAPPLAAQHRAPVHRRAPVKKRPPVNMLAAALPAMTRWAASIPGVVGAAAMIVETGDFVGVKADARFPMQSVYKFPIAWAVLARIDADKLRLSQPVHLARSDMVPGVHSPIRDQNPAGVTLTVRELLRAAIVESDGTASDVLATLVPLPEVNKMVHGLGVDSMMIVATERAMAADDKVQYRNWTTPRAAVQLLRAFQVSRAISAPSQVLLDSWLMESTNGDHRIKGMLPEGTAVAHKTGTSATRGGVTAATNDIGIVTLPSGRHLAVAVFIRDSKASESDRERTIARVTRMAWDAAVRQSRKSR